MTMPRRSIERSTPAEGNVIDLKTQKRVEIPAIPIICEQIRRFREKAGIEQKTMAKTIGVTPNAVSNWENGRSRPDINLIPGICEVLGIDLYELFGMESPGEQYSRREEMLIDNFRKRKPGNARLVESMAEEMLRVQEAEETPMLRRLQFYQKSLAAGCGDPSEFEGKALPIYLYSDMLSKTAGRSKGRRANCVFPVNGDSMEPDYHSGDLVLVERIPDAPGLKHGEIGAFIVGNETYIKEYADDGLVSLNPRYPLMRFDEENRVYLIGRVLGKLDPACIAASEDIERYRRIHPEEDLPGGSDTDTGNEIVLREFIDRYLK